MSDEYKFNSGFASNAAKKYNKKSSSLSDVDQKDLDTREIFSKYLLELHFQSKVIKCLIISFTNTISILKV